jgi:hypothetical protein
MSRAPRRIEGTGSSYSTYLWGEAGSYISDCRRGHCAIQWRDALVFKPPGKSKSNLRNSQHEKSFFAGRLGWVYGSPSFAPMWD